MRGWIIGVQGDRILCLGNSRLVTAVVHVHEGADRVDNLSHSFGKFPLGVGSRRGGRNDLSDDDVLKTEDLFQLGILSIRP